MAKTVLDKAYRAFNRKKFNDVIVLLEPQVIQYKESFPFFMCLALACLHSGDIGGAQSYLQRARQIKMRDPDLLVAQGALFLRRGDTNQAVEYYLEALDYQPDHKIAKKALDFIRKKGDYDTIVALVETGKITRFYPKLKKRSNLVPLLGIFVFFVFIFCVFGYFLFQTKKNSTSDRADLSSLMLTVQDRAELLELGGNYQFIMTEKEVIATYEKAQKYFYEWRDNLAQVELNRIMLSNASSIVKQKARLLMTYFVKPGFNSVKDSFSYQTVLKYPALYQDCWIIWDGMATNFNNTSNSMDFDFLVGYDMKKSLEGIVPVHFDAIFLIDSEKPLSILGKISIKNKILSIEGLSVHQSLVP